MPQRGSNKTLSEILFVSVIIIICLLSWHKSIYIEFLNDDFQIMLWNAPEKFTDIFSSFWKVFVNSSYWRPLPSIANGASYYFFGFDAFAFHVVNLAVYISCSLVAGYTLRKFGLSYTAALIAATLFALFPAHEIHVAWLASKYDTFIFIFILASSVYLTKYLSEGKSKYLIVMLIFFLAAVLSKEAAFSALILPLLYHFTMDSKVKEGYTKAILATILSATVIVVALAARNLMIGGSPFGSQNFSEISFLSLTRNFLLYIPASFITPETIEGLFHGLVGFELSYILSFVPASILVALLVIRFFRRADKKLIRLSLFGLAWYSFMIVPALPYFGRWYALMPSFGLLIFIAAMIQFYTAGKMKFAVIPLSFVLSFFLIWQNHSKMHDWVKVSQKTNEIMTSLKQFDYSGIETVTLWAAPDKINRINSMKIGLQQAFEYFTKTNHIDLKQPLKTEIGYNAAFDILKTNYKISIECTDGRFLQQGGRSTSIIKKEYREIIEGHYNILIRNYFEDKQKSKAVIRFNSLKGSNLDLIFTGDGFIKK